MRTAIILAEWVADRDCGENRPLEAPSHAKLRFCLSTSWDLEL